MFIVDVNKNIVKISQTEYVTSGSRNVYVTRFNLSEEWDALEATAVFRSGQLIINILLDETRECMIPWEVMTDPDADIYVGVFGTMEGDVVLPTIWGKMQTTLLGVVTGLPASPPTPDVYQQIVARLKKMQQQIDDGVPYALEAFVDDKITSMDKVKDLEMPCNVLVLNTDIGVDTVAREASLHYNNMVLYFENYKEVDSGGNTTYQALRVTDFIGYVYDFVCDISSNEKPFTERVLVRDTRGPQGEKGLTALEYGEPFILNSDNPESTVTSVSTDGFNRMPVEGDLFVTLAEINDFWTSTPRTMYLAVCEVFEVEESPFSSTGFSATVRVKTITKMTPDGLLYTTHLFTINESLSNQSTVSIPLSSFNRAVISINERCIGFGENADHTRTYLVIGKTFTSSDNAVSVQPISYINTKGERGEAGLNAIQYVGTQITKASPPEIGDQLSVNESDFNRPPVVDDVFLVIYEAVSTEETYIITAKVTSVVSGAVTISVIYQQNVTGKNGEQGEKGEPNLWCNYTTSSQKFFSTKKIQGSYSSTSENWWEEVFNREPKVGEAFDGMGVYTPTNEVFYITGEILSVDHLTDGSQTTFDFTGSINQCNKLNGPDGVSELWYNDSMYEKPIANSSEPYPETPIPVSQILNYFNRLPATGDKFTGIITNKENSETTFVVLVMGVISSFYQTGSGFNKYYNVGLTFDKVVDLMPSVGSSEEPSGFLVEFSIESNNSISCTRTSDEILSAIESGKLMVGKLIDPGSLLIYQERCYTGTYIFNFSSEYVQFQFFAESINATIFVTFTNNHGYYTLVKSLSPSLDDYDNPIDLPSNVLGSDPPYVLVHELETLEVKSVSISQLRNALIGRTTPITTADASYDSLQARGISLSTSLPTSMVNGAIYGIYS